MDGSLRTPGGAGVEHERRFPASTIAAMGGAPEA